MKSTRTLSELFSFNGFRAKATLTGKFGDPKARIVTLVRRKKRVSALAAERVTVATMIASDVMLAIWMPLVFGYILVTRDGVCVAQGVAACV
jgi:hypothetical protein